MLRQETRRREGTTCARGGTLWSISCCSSPTDSDGVRAVAIEREWNGAEGRRERGRAGSNYNAACAESNQNRRVVVTLVSLHSIQPSSNHPRPSPPSPPPLITPPRSLLSNEQCDLQLDEVHSASTQATPTRPSLTRHSPLPDSLSLRWPSSSPFFPPSPLEADQR